MGFSTILGIGVTPSAHSSGSGAGIRHRDLSNTSYGSAAILLLLFKTHSISQTSRPFLIWFEGKAADYIHITPLLLHFPTQTQTFNTDRYG